MNVYPWHKEIYERLLKAKPGLPHALLLKGRRGIGKLDFARQLARSLLCESPLEDGSACLSCTACCWFDHDIHPDFRRIEPETDENGKKAGQIAIDKIRSLSSFMGMTTHRNGYRIILIHPADAMNAHSANALLKTLEEPQGKTLFILVTHKLQQLLPTILSRCRTVSMPFPKPNEAQAWLLEKGVPDPIPFLAESGYAPLSALELVSEDHASVERFLKEIGSSSDPVSIAEAFQKTDLSMILSWLQKWCHDLASQAYAGKIRYFPGLSDRIIEISGKADKIELMRFQRKLGHAQRISTHPVNARLFLEELILTYRRMAEGR